MLLRRGAGGEKSGEGAVGLEVRGENGGSDGPVVRMRWKKKMFVVVVCSIKFHCYLQSLVASVNLHCTGVM